MNTNGIILKSSAPLPNQMLKFRRLYYLCFGAILLGCIVPALFAIGILGLMITYLAHSWLVTYRKGQLRAMKFQYDSSFSEYELFAALQPVLLSQYQGALLLERGEDNRIQITMDGHIYDLLLNDDMTFSLWWRKSFGKAFTTLNEYKSYRKMLMAYGILAYHIQQCCGVEQISDAEQELSGQ